MHKIISILNTKGGSGKTTLSTNIATCLYRQGKKVIIVDSDPQGSARDWHNSHPEELDLPPVIGIDRPTLHKDIPSISDSFDFIVIDGAARLEEMTASAVRISDFVLIPVNHSGFDLWAVEPLVEMIKARQIISDGKPDVAFLISAQTTRSRLAKSVGVILEEFDIKVFESRTSFRIAYKEAAGSGLSVFDLVGRDKSKNEIVAITEELKTYL